MDAKKWFTSKTIWVNVLAVAATFATSQFGVEVSAETQIAILGVVNFILRIVTKSEVVWQ